MKLTIKNYSSQERIEKDNNGVIYQHLGDMTLEDTTSIRAFVVYKVLNGNYKDNVFIEEKVNHKLSDNIWASTNLVEIKDDKLWDLLLDKALKEGVIK